MKAFIIDDDAVFSECLARYIGNSVEISRFSNAIEAVNALDEEVPDVIFLDVLLDGPDGFTFLNETASYSDTRKIPVVLVSSFDFSGKDLSDYGVVATLNKGAMTPEDVKLIMAEVVNNGRK